MGGRSGATAGIGYERPLPGLLALADEPKSSGSKGQGGTTDSPKAADSTKAKAKAAAGPVWNKEYELVVNFEINQPDAETGRYRRPYVAIWAEDKDGTSVRTMSLWVSMGGAGPFQWLPDLKRWYAGDQERKRRDKKELLFTVARPTRPPGKYKVIWDGKDDRGKPVPAGEYTHLRRGRARARDVPEHPQRSDPLRQAVQRGTQGQCRDPIRLDRVSSKGFGEIKVATPRTIPRGKAGRGGASSASGSPSSCSGCIFTCRCSGWRPSCSSA